MYVTMRPRRRGMGDLTTTITDLLPDAYSDTSTVTGLPLIWEIGLGLLGGVLLLSFAKKTGRRVRRSYVRARRRLS
jgi:hypothetical protein